MKAIFVHDHRFFTTPDGAVYTSGKLPYNTWRRYLKEFDELVVVSRSDTATEEQAAGLNLSSGERVSFVFVPNLAEGLNWFRHHAAVMDTLQREIPAADAVIARTSLLGGMAASIARRLGKPYAVEAVGDAWDSYWNYGGVAGKLYAPIAWWTMRHCLEKADFAIYVTRDYLQRRYPCRGVCAHASNVEINPVDDAVLARKVARWRSETTDSSRSLRVGLIGSLVNRYKGLHIALCALRRLKDQGLSLELHVLGQGKLDQWREEARQLGVAEVLHLDGSLPGGEQVMQWLDGMHLYIQPSLTEGLPRALIEAMSRGLPAIGSSCGGIPELLPSECLHRPGDHKTLARQLVKMAQDPAWRIQQAERNFREAQRYDRGKVDALRSAFWSQFAAAVRDRGRVST